MCLCVCVNVRPEGALAACQEISSSDLVALLLFDWMDVFLTCPPLLAAGVPIRRHAYNTAMPIHVELMVFHILRLRHGGWYCLGLPKPALELNGHGPKVAHLCLLFLAVRIIVVEPGPKCSPEDVSKQLSWNPGGLHSMSQPSEHA